MARDKALYVGHAIAAVAATSAEVAEAALAHIKVDYEVLPHVIDVEAAMAPDAPVLHDAMVPKGVTPKPDRPSNIAEKVFLSRGDAAAAFADPSRAEVVVEGRFTTEDRTLLSAEVVRAGKRVFQTLALNDIVVNKGAIGRLIEFMVHIDGQFVYDLRSDGLIVATPTGSTAYALSSNGPILQPNVPGMVLVPICPHTLSNRPITVSDTCVIDITLKRALDARLHFDGQPQFDLEENDRVLVARAEQTVRFVHPPGYSYYAMLREKLHWSENL